MPTPRRFYGWSVLAVFMLVLMADMAFPYFGTSVVAAGMVKELGFERTTLGLAITLLVLCTGLPGPLVAWVIGRIGVRRTTAIGALIVAAGTTLIALVVTATWQFVVLLGVVVGTGVAFSTSIPAQTTITKWFVRRRALALSVLWVAAGAGGAIAAPLMGWVLATTGNWRNGWYVMAALAAVAAVVAWMAIVDEPADLDQVPDGIAAGALAQAPRNRRVYQTSENWRPRLALRTRSFWMITAGAMANNLPWIVMLAHLVAYLRDLGYSPALGAAALGTTGLAQVAGKLIVGVLGDRFEPRYLWAGALVLMAGGLCLGISARGTTEIYAFVLLFGIGQGASLVAMPAMLGNYFGPAAFAPLSGVQMPVLTTLISVGPLIVGMQYDRTHTYLPSFGALVLALIVGATLVLFARPPRRVEEAVPDVSGADAVMSDHR